MAANFVVRQMVEKKLSASDINEGRVYLPTELVENLGLADGTKRVTVFDVQRNSSTMNLCRRRNDQRAFLGDGWRQFVTEKGFGVGDTVYFYVLRPQGGGIEPTYLQITRRAVGQFDDVFDLNR
jgi:hypothetical protein